MKTCKGTGKAKGSGCGDVKNILRFGLCFECYPKWLYHSEEGQELIIKMSLRGRKKVSTEKKKEHVKIKKENRFELLSYPKRVNEARKVFQKWIRERDKSLPCISCNNPFAEVYHAGHFKKAEIYSQLIFNEFNVNIQCQKCNTYLDGNEGNYRIGLVKKYGEEIVKELESAQPNKVYRYSNEELKNIINKYK